MYKSHKIIVVIPALNEKGKIGRVVRRTPRDVVDTILVIDDGSTDGTADEAREAGAEVISLRRARGVGCAIRRGFAEAGHRGADIVVVMAGNNKDSPEEISRLLDPICNEKCDFVVGSRFLNQNRYFGNMPLYRRAATRLHPLLMGLCCGKKLSESSNGYRALRVAVLGDRRIDLDQDWLDGYQLEVYLMMKLLKLGYRTAEVPVSKIYPPRSVGFTKVRPIIDWWQMLVPIFIISLGLECSMHGRKRATLVE